LWQGVCVLAGTGRLQTTLRALHCCLWRNAHDLQVRVAIESVQALDQTVRNAVCRYISVGRNFDSFELNWLHVMQNNISMSDA
jgi:hypothetical protein